MGASHLIGGRPLSWYDAKPQQSCCCENSQLLFDSRVSHSHESWHATTPEVFFWWFYVGFIQCHEPPMTRDGFDKSGQAQNETKNHEPHRHSASPYSWNTNLGVALATPPRCRNDGRSQNPENFGSRTTVKTMELPELWNYSKKNPCCLLNKWQFWSRLKTIVTLVLVFCALSIFPTHSYSVHSTYPLVN